MQRLKQLTHLLQPVVTVFMITSEFAYIEKDTFTKKEQVTRYSMESYPEKLRKKVTALKELRDAFGEVDVKGQMVYVRKWLRVASAIMLQLSNKQVQAMFDDKSQVLLNAESREATYIDYIGRRITQPISAALESGNKEMVDKIKYANKMLAQMLSKKGGILAI